MRPDKWDAIAVEFDRGERVPANGWDAWRDQAIAEAVKIREALPDSVETILEVGCGIGRLTPHLSTLFRSVIAMDTSRECRRVTLERCDHRWNVTVTEDPFPAEPPDAAVVWKLYDEDWTLNARDAHLNLLEAAYRYVLHSNNGVDYWLYER